MLQVSWKIGKKPRGNWRPPLDFKIEIIQQSESEIEILACRPRLVFSREYALPGEMYAGKDAMRRGAGCQTTRKIKIDINTFISSPDLLLGNTELFMGCSCAGSGCKLYLEWRPGKPDYSDFEAVFHQIAADLIEAWNKALEEAMASEEYEGEEVVVTPDSIFKKKEEEKPTGNQLVN